MAGNMSEQKNEQCPVCGTKLYNHTNSPTPLFCDGCEMEYWREGENWFRCGEDGHPHHVVEQVEDGNGPLSYIDHPARYPGEGRVLIAIPDMKVKHAHREPRRWRYVFKLYDWTGNARKEDDGIHACLSTIYAPNRSGGTDTIAVNGATRVPEFIRDAMADLKSGSGGTLISGFGRPPFIPGRDGEPVGPEPTLTDGGGE